jgi:hypothetical protein
MYGKDDELESEQMEEADMDIPRFNKSLVCEFQVQHDSI